MKMGCHFRFPISQRKRIRPSQRPISSRSVFKAPPHKWLLIALGWEVALIAVLIQIPTVREAFGIIKPSFSDLAIITGFGLVVFAIIEATKVVLRKKMPAGRKINSLI